MLNDFIWCDLSAHRPAQAVRFYEALLGWRFDAPQGGYHNAFTGDDAVAGLCETPGKFREMGMPSFWMSYIAVASMTEAVKAAKAHGGRVELQESMGADAGAALIRDPLGAGFTVYEGALEPGATGVNAAGRRAGHALYVSDASAVEPFYAALFGWRFRGDPRHREIIAPNGETIAAIHECGEEQRGGFEYWGVGFTVADLEVSRKALLDAGGASFGEMRFGDYRALSVADTDNAAFFMVERAQ